jgi:hypothetical protein
MTKYLIIILRLITIKTYKVIFLDLTYNDLSGVLSSRIQFEFENLKSK